MSKIYGTLEYSTQKWATNFLDDNKSKLVKRDEPVWLVHGFEVVRIIHRLIPDVGSLARNEAEIADTISNIDYLNWVMMRYPLDIRSKSEWNKRLEKLEDVRQQRSQIQNLKQIPKPRSFKGKLYNFQKEGLDFLTKLKGNALLADEMGLGKGVQVLAFIAKHTDSTPALIISPLVVLRHWKNEIEKFVRLEDGSVPKVQLIRSGKSADLKKANFYVINYDLVSKRRDDIARAGIQTMVMDEAHYLRNIKTKKFDAAHELAALPSVKYRIGLSGTPIYNRGSEIWGIIDIIQKGLLGTHSEFTREYCSMDYRGNYYVESDKRDALAEVLRENIMLRRRKEQVLTELPEKIRHQQNIDINQEYYESEIEKIFERLEQEKAALAANTEKKYHVFELQGLYEKALNNERQVAGISKVPEVIKYVTDLMELEEKIVVFCHHHIVHGMLVNGLNKFNPQHIVGGQNDNKRQDNIDLFQKDEDSRLMIAGLRAGNVGINLTAASYVIFAELDWSPAVHRQAEDRLHRIGQKKTVFSHYLIGEGTLDESITAKLVDKRLEIDSIMGDKAEPQEKQKAIDYLQVLQQRITVKKMR